MTDWRRSIATETQVARIIHQQELNGVEFDLKKANRYIEYLTKQRQRLYDEVRPYLKTEVVRPYAVEIKEPYKRDGTLCQAVLKWYTEEVPAISGPFSRIRFQDPDIGSRQKLTKQLLEHGWKPELFTDKGAPKLTEKGEPVPSLLRIKAPIGKKLAKWYVIQHRQSQIQGWINKIRPDGRLTAGANSCGTNTGRMRHRNVVNVPKASSEVLFGYQMRDLFIARKGYSLVGHDASGLEARVMGHYTFPIDNGAFATEILHGDIHSKNAIGFFEDSLKGRIRGDEGFEEYRDKAKQLFYALIYGAQVSKVMYIVGCSRKKAQKIFDAFWELNPGLGRLRDKVIKIANKQGWLPGLDGRRIYVRSSHSALNALFQSAGAIIMKESMILLEDMVRKAGLEVIKVLDMHDEAQAEVPNSDIARVEGSEEEVRDAISRGIWTSPKEKDGTFSSMYCQYGEFAVKSIREAGEVCNLRCDLDAEYKIGRSWAETH